jgi:poly-gamma-glutamate capsule biosynthesis protein CapA/YwtB (metallophosphatase superfamily)
VIRGLVGVFILVMPLTACRFQAGSVSGRVIDLAGKPIAAVQIRHGAVRTSSGADGRFRLSVPAGPGWIEASRAGYASALRPVQPGLPILLRLSPADSETVVLHAVGDVMAGRRFFSGDPSTHQPPQLLPGDGVAAHQRLLEAVQPLLARADLSLVNLESSLLPDPVAERRGFRAPAFHPTTHDVFASSLALPVALQRAGVDIVGLANNHIFDALDPGLTSTLETLHLAGFRPGVGMFGAGATVNQAWLPAVRTVGSQTFSVLGCTTIHGSQHPISYVASAEQSKSGAALCEAKRLQASVRAARALGPVVVMLHGGNEFWSEPTPPIAQMADVARRAGATLVLIHHSHVLGGFHWDGRSLVALGLGNFLFDQTLWSTSPSQLLEVHLHRGVVQRVIVYPLLLHRYRPHPAVGELAGWILRGIAAKSAAPWVIQGDVMELDVSAQAQQQTRWLSMPAASQPSELWSFRSQATVCGWRGEAPLELGRSLLAGGNFEDQLVGARSGEGALWALFHNDQRIERGAARSGTYGVRLRRSAMHRQPVLLRPLHRVPVQPGERLTFLAWLRGPAGVTPRVQISWYGALRGASVARVTRSIPLPPHRRWHPVRLDLQVPEHVVAVSPAIALDSPGFGQQWLDLDDLDLVRWQQPGGMRSQPADWLRSRGAGSLCLNRLQWRGQDPQPLALQAWP